MNEIFNYEFYARNFMKINTKSGLQVPFVFNGAQAETYHLIQEIRKQRLPVRIIALKARQVGFSTFGAGLVYHSCATEKYQTGQIIADDDSNTNKIFTFTKRFYEKSPVKIRPMKRYSNRKALIFDNPSDKTRDDNPGLESQVIVESAGKATAGRAGTVRHLHISEYAFWPNASELATGLYQSVPLMDGTIIFIESTANGVSGRGLEFYNKWNEAVEDSQKSVKLAYIPIFIPWWTEPSYELDDPDFEPTLEEIEIQKQIPEITNKKLAWRRYKIRNDMGKGRLDPLDQFAQEYPATPDQAFITSGRPLFDTKQVDRDIAITKDLQPYIGEMDSLGTFREKTGGWLKVFEKPNPEKVYALGADVSEGLETGDDSTVHVVDTDGNQVAGGSIKIDPDLFGAELVKIAKWYNNALLAWEVNNHGQATKAKIKELRYFNTYKRQIKDKSTDQFTLKIGWITTSQSKTEMVDNYTALYRDEYCQLKDVDLLREMRRLMLETDGDVTLNSQDMTVAAMIAHMALKQVPKGKRKVSYDRGHDKQKYTSFQERLKKQRPKDESYFF